MDILDNFKIVGHFGGATQCIRVDGKRLFCGFGPKLSIFDIAEPEKPELLGGVMLGETNIVQEFCVAGDYAYVIVSPQLTPPIEGGLVVVDISNPHEPWITGYLGTRFVPTDIACGGTHVYLAELDNGLLIVNVADPASPSIASNYRPKPIDENITPHVWHVSVANEHAFLNVGGIDIVNISDAHNPRRMGYIELYTKHFAISLHLAVTGRVTVVDISRPVEPVILGSAEVDEWWEFVQDVTVQENLVVTVGVEESLEGYLRLFDISVPSQPRYLGAIALPAYSVAAGEKHFYAASVDRGGIAIVDVSGQQPRICAEYLSPPSIDRVLVDGESAYVTGDDAFYALDIADPLHPVATGFFSGKRNVHGMDVLGTTAYLAEGPLNVDAIVMDGKTGGLRILDISDRREPRILVFMS